MHRLLRLPNKKRLQESRVWMKTSVTDHWRTDKCQATHCRQISIAVALGLNSGLMGTGVDTEVQCRLVSALQHAMLIQNVLDSTRQLTQDVRISEAALACVHQQEELATSRMELLHQHLRQLQKQTVAAAGALVQLRHHRQLIIILLLLRQHCPKMFQQGTDMVMLKV